MMTEDFIQEQYERFSKWYGALDPKKQKKFKSFWLKGFFHREDAFLDRYMFSSNKRREELLSIPAAKECIEELDFFDLTEKDTDKFVYVWRSGLLEDMHDYIKTWMGKKNGSTDKGSDEQDTSGIDPV